MSRADDMRMLLEALELESLNAYERDAFASMLDDLRATQRELSTKQREWVANKLDVQVNVKPCGRKLRELRHAHAELAPCGRKLGELRHAHAELAPCGPECPAWQPPTLAILPKRPPGRAA